MLGRQRIVSLASNPHGVLLKHKPLRAGQAALRAHPRAWRGIHTSPCLKHAGHSHGTSSVEEIEDESLRAAANRITWIGVAANVGMTGLKGAAGYASGSTSLLADAVHNLSDLAGDAVTLVTLRMTTNKPDEKHPYGYGKYEGLGTLAISGVLLATAGEVGHEACQSLISVASLGSSPLQMAPVALGVASLCVVTKEMLFRMTLRVGQRARSSVVIGNAWHHRSDAMSSVVAIGGIGGVMLGFPYMDGVGGLVVAGYTAKQAVDLGLGAVKELTDQQVNIDIVEGSLLIGKELVDRGEIVELEKIRCRLLGSYSLVDCYMAVDANISVEAGHAKGVMLRKAIMTKFPEVHDVMVHVCPSSPHGGCSPDHEDHGHQH